MESIFRHIRDILEVMGHQNNKLVRALEKRGSTRRTLKANFRIYSTVRRAIIKNFKAELRAKQVAGCANSQVFLCIFALWMISKSPTALKISHILLIYMILNITLDMKFWISFGHWNLRKPIENYELLDWRRRIKRGACDSSLHRHYLYTHSLVLLFSRSLFFFKNTYFSLTCWVGFRLMHVMFWWIVFGYLKLLSVDLG